MSWAGLLRRGDRFGPSRRSRRAVLVAVRGPRLARYFGAWSARYRRFTGNLSSPNVRVRVLEPSDVPGPHLQAIVHFVDRAQFLRGPDRGPPASDGWPAGLWEGFLEVHEQLRGASVAEKLDHLLRTPHPDERGVVGRWREVVRAGADRVVAPGRGLGSGWVPVPVPLRGHDVPRFGLLSWSPSPRRFGSLREALAAPASRRRVDARNQARYYFECALATLHGVRFTASDALVDPRFERAPAVQRLRASMTRLELGRLRDPRFGRLDRRG